MPEIEPYLADDAVTRVSPPSPRTALFWDGTHWHVPRVDDEGRVQVRGEDQLFSIKAVFADEHSRQTAGADEWVDSHAVPASTYWVVHTIGATDQGTPTTALRLFVVHNGTECPFYNHTQATAAWEYATWHGQVLLDSGDHIRAYLIGSANLDWLRIIIGGYSITLET